VTDFAHRGAQVCHVVRDVDFSFLEPKIFLG